MVYDRVDCHLVAENITAQEAHNFQADLDTYIWKKNEGNYLRAYSPYRSMKSAIVVPQEEANNKKNLCAPMSPIDFGR